MASPQTENGHTRIANEILEAVARCKFNGTQFRILTVVWRYTYGFQRKQHELSVNFLVDATGITKRQIQKELTNLIDENVIIEVKAATFNTSRIIAFNKDYETWNCYTSTPKEQQMNNSYTGEQLDTSTGEQLDTSTGEQLDTQERKIKERLKKEEEETKNPFSLYQENFGVMNMIQAESLEKWIGDFNNNIPVINEAIRQTALANPRNAFPFLNRILVDWHKRGLVTMEKIQFAIEEHERIKNPTKNRVGKNGLTQEEREAFLKDE